MHRAPCSEHSGSTPAGDAPATEATMTDHLTTTGDAPASLTTPTVRGTVTYRLSTAGQAASLLAGGDGRQQQALADVAIPADLLGLCDITAEGAVTLDLSAHWPEARVYDTPPRIIDEPCPSGTRYQPGRTCPMWHDAPVADPIASYFAALEAARAQVAQRLVEVDAQERKSREAAIAWVRPRAHAVLAGGEAIPALCEGEVQLARCDEPTRVLHAAALAAQESRYRAAKAAQAARAQAAAQAKADYLDAWVAAHGTDDLRERHAAQLLPTRDLMAALEDWTFADLGNVPRYARITGGDVAALFGYDEGELVATDITCQAGDADEATAAQWAALKALRARVADDETATVTLRRHRCWWDHRAKDTDPEVVRYGLLVRCRRGPLVLEREFGAPDAELGTWRGGPASAAAGPNEA